MLSADFTELGRQVKTVQAVGGDWIHLDIMDGHFVPNMSMGRLAVEACRRSTQLPLDVHLMVEAPENFLEIFAAAGADWLTIHIEATKHIHRAIQKIHQLGCRAGVALNPGTPASAVESILHTADLILVMSVNPGFGGQEFIPEVLPKIASLRRQMDLINPEAMIQVDGGITATNLPQIASAGAQVFVAGSAIFKHPAGLSAGIRALKSGLPG